MTARVQRLQAAVLTALCSAVHAQALPAEAPDAMPLADYLGLLEQIAPAARQGAEAYLRAYQRRCGRAMSTGELRQAMSTDGGEPTLMAMIRASHLQDAKSLAALERTLPCRGRK